MAHIIQGSTKNLTNFENLADKQPKVLFLQSLKFVEKLKNKKSADFHLILHQNRLKTPYVFSGQIVFFIPEFF